MGRASAGWRERRAEGSGHRRRLALAVLDRLAGPGRVGLWGAAAQRDLDHPERRPIRKVLAQQRRRDVVDRDAGLGAPLQAAVMGMAVENGADRIAVQPL